MLKKAYHNLHDFFAFFGQKVEIKLNDIFVRQLPEEKNDANIKNTGDMLDWNSGRSK